MPASSRVPEFIFENRQPQSRLTLCIGGISLGLTSESTQPPLVPDAGMGDFLVASRRCDVELTVGFSDRLDTNPGELVFDSGGLWKLFRVEEGYCFSFVTDFLGALPYKQARVSPDFSSGRIALLQRYFSTNAVLNPLEYPLDELMWIHRLAMGEGVEVHGCGLRTPDGRGLLLTGHSGAGKSTSARLWSQQAGVRVLSDDRIILRRDSGRIWMYGTPWHGDAGIAAADRCLLDGIFVLAHGTRNRLCALRAAAASAELFARSFVPHHSPNAVGFILDFFARVTSCVPCFQFSFVPDVTAVEALLREELGKTAAA